MDIAPDLLHATAIALDGDRAAVIMGPSGAGKSDLALRCILHPMLVQGQLLAAQLVSDDQVSLHRSGADVIVRPPATIAGRMEVRGLGILQQPYLAQARLTLAVELVSDGLIERLPDPWPTIGLLRVDLPLLRVDPREASAPAKVLLALAHGLPI